MIEITKHLEQTDNPHIIIDYAEADEQFCIPASEIPTLISHLIEMGGVDKTRKEVLKSWLWNSDKVMSKEEYIFSNYHLVPKKKI